MVIALIVTARDWNQGCENMSLAPKKFQLVADPAKGVPDEESISKRIIIPHKGSIDHYQINHR